MFQAISSPALAHQTTRASRRLSRSVSRLSQKETRDPRLDVNLPYRTLSSDANLEEYTTENQEGEIPAGFGPNEKTEYQLVTFLPNDPENPKNWSKAFKWWCTMVVAITCFVVAFASSVVTADIAGVQKEFGVSEEVALLSITLFVMGFGIGTIQSFLRLDRVLISSRTHGFRAFIRNVRSSYHVFVNTSSSRRLYHPMRGRQEYSNSSCLQSSGWYCIFSTYHPCWRHTGRSLED